MTFDDRLMIVLFFIVAVMAFHPINEYFESTDSLLTGVTHYKHNPNKPCDLSKCAEDTDPSGVCKCIKECDGNCLEYGYTGDAICFPKNQPTVPRIVFEANEETKNDLKN
jgi:hypothetical protein